MHVLSANDCVSVELGDRNMYISHELGVHYSPAKGIALVS